MVRDTHQLLKDNRGMCKHFKCKPGIWRCCARALGTTARGETPAAAPSYPSASTAPSTTNAIANPPSAGIAASTSRRASPAPVCIASSAAKGIGGPPVPNCTAPTDPYLLAGAPTFDTTVTKFRERYNSHNPTLPIGEFRALEGLSEPANLTRAASKINETLYAATALEKGSGKIKTLQLTYLPVEGGTEKASRATAYMVALLREF